MVNSSDKEERELLPLSYLSQYGYCPRRCGLLLLERLWADNEYTAAGAAEHQRVHDQRIERRGGLLKLYGIWVWSRSMGLSGLCDCIEARQDPSGVALPFGEGRWLLYPIEYKHGTVRDEREYQLQLCAQAMCLEERYGCTITEGALFYLDAHRRDPVCLTASLRREVKETADALAALWERGVLPAGIFGPKCKKCSLKELCQPKVNKSAEAYCRELWKQVSEEAEI